jgi:hypothetical protein
VELTDPPVRHDGDPVRVRHGLGDGGTDTSPDVHVVGTAGNGHVDHAGASHAGVTWVCLPRRVRLRRSMSS